MGRRRKWLAVIVLPSEIEQEKDQEKDADSKKDQAKTALHGENHGNATKQEAEAMQNRNDLAMRETHVDQAVMDVTAVGVHGIVPGQDTAENGNNHITQGEGEKNHRNQEGNGRIKLEHSLHRQGTQHVSQKQRTGITHKGFGRMTVEGEETKAGTKQTNQCNGAGILGGGQRNDEHAESGYSRNTTGKSVQPVQPVQCIGDGNDPQNRNGN